jgi:hypothetical protein
LYCLLKKAGPKVRKRWQKGIKKGGTKSSKKGIKEFIPKPVLKPDLLRLAWLKF